MIQNVNHINQFGFGSNVFGGNQPSSGFVRYWEIGEYAELMQQLECFLETVLETDQVPFDIRDQAGQQRAVRNLAYSGYRSLSGFMSQCALWMDLYWPGYAYSADLQLFFDCFMQHPFAQVFGNGTLSSNVDKAVAANLYNDFVGCLRMEAVRRGVRKWLWNWRGNLSSQETSIRHYIGTLQARHKTLLPVRVDLYYADFAADDNDALVRMGWTMEPGAGWVQVLSNAPVGHGRAETRARIDPRVAMQDRDLFFGNRRGADRALFDPMVGHICKMEQGGRHRANHFHCIFFFDAQQVRQDQLCALKYAVADRWRRVTRGQGLMFDCHERADQARLRAQGRWAIDAIDCADPMQVAKLADYVASYLAKDDGQMIRVKPTPKAWTLTTGR
ncbi:inovirus-type Gp2 protein [Burkholderia cenocepacia]|uniref:inovirus-type Gp2 protein n=1 Tax=Burkholderia cenocepacia TaxID=95486 RepID=UPI001B9524AE|nr:inovirus-type Gp2 protein [Burkholderia cenocepacia]MBR8091831.1 inovirus-type Gp2 protein [Burkholderia cenocepacia]